MTRTRWGNAVAAAAAAPVTSTPDPRDDTISDADVARLVDETARGRLKSAKALRDALQLPSSVERVEQLLRNGDFQARVHRRIEAQWEADDVQAAIADAEVTEADIAASYDDDDEYDIVEDDNDDDDDADDIKAPQWSLSSLARVSESVSNAAQAAKATTAAMPASLLAPLESPQLPPQLSTTTTTTDALPTPRKRYTSAPNATATAIAIDGSTLTLRVGQTFPDRATMRLAIRAFVNAQHKSVQIHKQTNGGSNFTYICKSPTPCLFFCKVRRVNRQRSTVFLVLALHGDHGVKCTGQQLKRERRARDTNRRVFCTPVSPVTITARDGVTQLTLALLQEFPSRTILRDFVYDFALAQRKRARVDRACSGGNNTTFMCTSPTPCSFHVRTLRSKKNGLQVVRSFDVNHSVSCTGKSTMSKRQVLKHMAHLDATPTTLGLSATDVQTFVKTQLDDVDVTPRIASDVRVELVERARRDAEAGVQRLESLLTHFASLNATATAHVAFDGEAKTLTQAFVCMPHAAQLQQCGSLPVLGLVALDMAPASNVHRGLWFELTTRDGNNDACVLAIGLFAPALAGSGSNSRLTTASDSVTLATAAFTWFLDACVASGIVLDATTPVLCDRTAALLSAAAARSTQLPLLQCTQSLICNIEERLERVLPPAVRSLILAAQDADSADAFARIVTTLETIDAGAALCVRAVDAHTWAKHCVMQRYVLYGYMSASLTPGADVPPTLLAQRSRGPFELFQSYMERCMQRAYDSKRNAKRWASSGQTLTAFAENVLTDMERYVSTCRVVPSDAELGIAYVTSSLGKSVDSAVDRLDEPMHSPMPSIVPMLSTKCRVNLSAHSCTCPTLTQRGLPCPHVVAAARLFNADSVSLSAWDMTLQCDALFSVKRYFDVYAHARPIDLPDEDELMTNKDVHVVAIKTITRTVHTTSRCSLCQVVGHNKRRCPTVVQSNDANDTMRENEEADEEAMDEEEMATGDADDNDSDADMPLADT